MEQNIMPEIDNSLPGFTAYNAENKTRVKFYKRRVLNEAQSLEVGSPVYDEVDFCLIPLGGRDTWDQPIREVDKQRFPAEYAKFKQGSSGFDTESSTLLKFWTEIPEETMYQLISDGFVTVEEVANCPDGSLGRLGLNGLALRKKAKAFLENKVKSTGESRIKQLEDATALQAAQIESLLKMNQELLSRLDVKSQEGKAKGK